MIGQGLGIHRPERVASLTLCNTTSWSTPWYRGWVEERQAVVRAAGGMAPVWEMTRRLWFTDAYVDAEGPGFSRCSEARRRSSFRSRCSPRSRGSSTPVFSGTRAWSPPP